MLISFVLGVISEYLHTSKYQVCALTIYNFCQLYPQQSRKKLACLAKLGAQIFL